MFKRRISLLILPILGSIIASPISAETLAHIGSAQNGAELYVDRDSMRTTRGNAEFRPFDAVQLWAIYDLQGVKRDPARSERALYSFNCRQRTSNTLAYQRYRANGTRLHDWKAADVDFKYSPVEPGSLTEQAMEFACSGGIIRPPITPDSQGLVRVDGDDE